jgi:SAM-dependent methyltransferase
VSRYGGSAPYYVLGRMPYPEEIAPALGLDGTQRLLDVGCGPGSLTRVLAPHVAEAIAIDADAEMLAAAPGLANVRWKHMRGEDLPGDLGPFDIVTFAQSLHWMDRSKVAAAVRTMLNPGGVLVHVQATTHRGDTSTDPLPHPRPPHAAIAELVSAYVGPAPPTKAGEAEVLRAAGFTGPRRIELSAGDVVIRTTDDVVAATFSLSTAAPERFGDRRAAFEADLRALLGPGPFAERRRAIALDIWS